MGCFEVSRPVARRMRIAAELPTEHPAVLDEVQTLLGSLPDPDTMCAEQRAGTMTELARLRNQIDACLTELAETADQQDDSRVLHAGTTGMLVAVATRANPQTGSAVVARGRALQGRMQQGMVTFASGAPWYDSLKQEMLRFPAGVNDDQVDSLAWLAQMVVGREPPHRPKAPEMKSWKDKLSMTGAGSHMVA